MYAIKSMRFNVVRDAFLFYTILAVFWIGFSFWKCGGECWWMDWNRRSASEWVNEQVNEFTLSVLCRWSSRFRQVWLRYGNDGICTMAKWLAESMPIQCSHRNSVEPTTRRKENIFKIQFILVHRKEWTL